MSRVRGLHHVTAIAGNARRNLTFWREVLGLRFVKKTVNFDDPTVYHLYYGDELGRPGSVMTFFPWEHAAAGRRGAGEVARTQLAVPRGACDWWRERLATAGLETTRDHRFGEPRLALRDPEGLDLALVEAADDDREPWLGAGVPVEVAIRGLHGVTLALADPAPTASMLIDLMDFATGAEAAGVRRLEAPAGSAARFVELVATAAAPARLGAGSVHHVAFAVADRAAQDAVRARLVEGGFRVTPPIDRDYFHAVYVRGPGGVLFEVATEGPGFTVDEPAAALGSALRLPRRHAHRRAALEAALPPLD
ncbi:MAG: ring-cleaving dioxygenase [Alphaproteobacteria bacterium]|jgi:glyoxalase family protein|nr:ring-cleaving dioxygenase [Alphaproteobacteria bacterium]